MHPPARGPALDLLWLVPLSLVVLAGSWFTNVPQAHPAHVGYAPWSALTLAGAAAAGMFAALARPLPGAGATFAAATLFLVVDLRDGPIYLSLAAVAFLVSARVPARSWLPVVVGGSVATSAGLVVRLVVDGDRERSPWQLVAVTAIIAAGAAIGSLTRSRALAVVERARAAATSEQLRMAQDLHDGVGHGLAVIAMHAGIGLHVLDHDPQGAQRALEAIRASAKEALEALRAELAQVWGVSGHSSGHTPAQGAPRRPRPGVADLDALVQRVRAAGLDVEVAGSPGPLDEGVGAVVYGVVQEGLTNALRHASTASVRVVLDRTPDQVAVTVEDDGRGSRVSAAQSEQTGRHESAVRSVADGGMGLRGMRERVRALDGDFSAGPLAAGGFVVRAVLPL